MRLGAAVERLHHGARQQLDLLAGGVMQLHLALKRLDRGLDLALARHHGQARRRSPARASAGGSRSRSSEKRWWIASTLLRRNRLLSSRPITAPAPAMPAATAVAASTPKAVLRANARGNPADRVDRKPADEEHRQARERERDHAVAAARATRAATRQARRLGRRDALGPLGQR